MDLSESDSHFRERPVDLSPSYDRSTPGYQISGRILNRHINPRWNHDSVVGAHPTIRYGQNHQGMQGDYVRGGEDLYFSSPFSTECSWREEYNTPNHPLKRFSSPSAVDYRPNKRPQGYNSPAGMNLSPPIRGDVFNQGLFEGGEYWDERQIDPDGLGNMHPSATCYLSQRRYDAKRHNHATYQNPPQRRDWLQSTPHGLDQTPRHPNIDAIQSDGQRYAKRTQTVDPESRQGFQDRISQTLFAKRPSLPAPQPLHSPIWNDDASRGRQRRRQCQDKRTRSYSQSPQRKSGKHELRRVYPFDDGGIPGEGGSSSDGEGILLDPVIIGRETHQGGTRGGYVAEGSGKEATTILEALQELEDNPYVPMDMETIWNRQDRVNRRKLKLTSRKFKAQWDTANAKNDCQEMKKIEAKARKQQIPLRGQRERVLSRSPSPYPPSRRLARNNTPYSPSATRIDCAIPSPHHNDLVANVDQPNPSHRSENSRKSTPESRCSHRQSRLTGLRTITEGGRNQRGVSQVPNTHHQEHSATLKNIADEFDSTPMEQLFRTTRRTYQLGDISGGPYRAAHELPNESILYNDHANPGDENTGRRHLHSLIPQTGNDHDEAHGIKCEDGVVITPRSHFQPEPDAYEARAMNVDSPEVINLLSSTEGTPVPPCYQPMKERLDPPRKKAASKKGKFRANIPRAAEGKGNAKMAEVADAARQQRCADVIVAKESKVANEDFQKEIFGDVIGLTAEEKEHGVELKRKEAQLKQEAELQAEIDKVQAQRFELEEQKAIEEARVKERLAKNREEQSKKLRREVERKKQLQIEEGYREEKRRLTTERIEAQRAKDKAGAEAREKEQEKIRTIEFDKLRLEIMRKDLELKRLQAASLSAVKVSGPEAFKNPATDAKPPIDTTEDSLFISDDADVMNINDNRPMQPMIAGARSVTELFAKHSNFQSMVAEDRERVQAEQRVLGAQKKAAAIQVRLNAMRKSAESVKEKPKQSQSRKSLLSAKVKTKYWSEDPQNTQANSFISYDSSERQSVQPNQRKSCLKRPERPVNTPVPNSAPVYAVEPLKVYSSEVRLHTDVEVENTEKVRKARDEEIKRKHLADRRARELPHIALKHKNKLIEEAAMAGFTLSDDELKFRVESHMKKLEEAYQKKKAKKTGSTSFDSYLGSQSQLQGPEQQKSTQPQAQQEPLWFSRNSSETEQGDRKSRIQDLVQSELPAATRSQRRVRTVSDLAACLPKAFADKYQSDSESEEDPDDEEALEEPPRSETGAGHTEGSGSEANKCSVNPHGTQLERGMEVGSVTQGVIPNSSADSNSEVANTQSQNLNQKDEPQIKIYKVKKNEMKGAQELAESIKILHDREQANEMAKDLLKLYRQQADGEERSFSREFKDGLFYGRVELNDDNTMEVRVTSEFATPSKFGIDMSEVNNLHGEQVFIIKQELKRTVKDPETTYTSTTHLKEDINDLVYTDRSYANTLACEEFIKYLKPPKQYQALYEKCWANDWSKQMRDALEMLEGTNECFEVEIDRTELADGALAWLEWDIVRYVVEVRKTHGPRN